MSRASGPPSPAEMLRFDLSRGLPLALGLLRRHLGATRAARALLGVLRRAAGADPLAALGPTDDPGEAFSRRQLRPVLLLDDTLTAMGVSADTQAALLEDLAAETGARFIDFALDLPDPATWRSRTREARRAAARAMVARFGNARAELSADSDVEVIFDVRFCHFVDLTRRLGRPELARLFCAADARYFGSEASPVTLERPQTLAAGDPACGFKFEVRPGRLPVV